MTHACSRPSWTLTLRQWPGIALFIACCRCTYCDGLILVDEPRRDFFSGEATEITSVTVLLDNRVLSSATLFAQIEVAAATIARASRTCSFRDGKWSGSVGLTIPSVERRIQGTLLLRVAAGSRILGRTELRVRLYPPRDQFRRSFAGRQFLLIDPNRSIGPILESNGIAFSTIEPWQLGRAEMLPLLIGRDAMSNWLERDTDLWRQWLEKGGRAIVLAQGKVPMKEFQTETKGQNAAPPKPALLVFHTPLALSLYESAPHRWRPSVLSDAAPLPLPRAKEFWVLALAEPFDPEACCRVVEIAVGQGRSVFVQYPVDKFYESEPGARVLWEALLEEVLRPVPESQPPAFRQ